MLTERFIRARLHAADERPARSARQQAAAPRHQAGQHLPAHGRHADAARLRRRAADAVSDDISKTVPDVHARASRAPEQYHSATPSSGRGPTSTAIGACIYACIVRHAAAGAGPARMKDDHMPAALRQFRGLYSAQLLEMIDWCLQLELAGATADRLCSAEGTARQCA
ncbi:MAG: hypothetical protein MZV65_13265 [Chromatiales bacterium]|nr:hypothetical protein [Chromatiales bacterium]